MRKKTLIAASKNIVGFVGACLTESFATENNEPKIIVKAQNKEMNGLDEEAKAMIECRKGRIIRAECLSIARASSKGLKIFVYNGECVVALNKKNADRKARKLGLL